MAQSFQLSRAASRGRCSWCGQGHHCVQSLGRQTQTHTDTRTHGHTYTHTHHTTPQHTTHYTTHYTTQHTTPLPQHMYTTHYTTQHNTTQHNTNQPLHHLPLSCPPFSPTSIFALPPHLASFLYLIPFVRPHTYTWSFDVVLCIYTRFSFTKPWRLWQQCMNLKHGGLSCARPFESAMQQRTSGGRLYWDGMQEKPGHHHTLTHLWRSCFRTRMHSNRTCAILVQWTVGSSSTMSCTTRVRQVGRTRMTAQYRFQTLPQEVNLEPAKLAKVFRWIVLTKHHRCDESDDNYFKFFMNFDMAVLRVGYMLPLSDTRRMCARSSSMCPKVRGRVAGAPTTGRRLHLMWGVIMIIIQNGQSLSPVLNGGASIEWTKTCLVRASVRQSVHSLTLHSLPFTLHCLLFCLNTLAVTPYFSFLTP